MGNQSFTDSSKYAADYFTSVVDTLKIKSMGPIEGLTTKATLTDDKFTGTQNLPNAIQNGSSIKI